MSYVSVVHSDEQVGYKGNCHSLGEWRHLVSYQVAQSRTGGHSDVTVGLVPTRSDMSASPFIIVIGCVPVWMNVSVEPFFDHVLIRYKCCAFLRSCVDQM